MIYRRGTWYWMDNAIDGVRYRVPLETKNWQEALQLEKEKLAELGAGKSTVRWAMARKPFGEASG